MLSLKPPILAPLLLSGILATNASHAAEVLWSTRESQAAATRNKGAINRRIVWQYVSGYLDTTPIRMQPLIAHHDLQNVSPRRVYVSAMLGQDLLRRPGATPAASEIGSQVFMGNSEGRLA